MNIWLMNHHAVTMGRHYQFARTLASWGHHVTLFSASFRHNDYRETKDYGRQNFFVENHENVRIVWVKTPPYKGNDPKRLLNQIVFARRAENWGRGQKRSSERPHVVLGSSIHLFTVAAARRLARHFGVPFVFEVRDLWPQTLIDLGAISPRGLTARIFGRMERDLYQAADVIVSVLPHAHRYICALGIDAEKIVHIPNGINLEWFDACAENPLPADAASFFQQHRDSFVVTYAGAMGLANGLETVLDAAAILEETQHQHQQHQQHQHDHQQHQQHQHDHQQHQQQKPVHILLLGDGPQKSKLQEKARRLQLNNVTFLSRVERNEVPAVLRNSQACLFHLKRTEVFKYGVSSNKIFDYLAAQRPLIYALSDGNDIAGEAGCGPSIPSEDPQAMAEAMRALSALPETELQKLGDNGRSHVEQKHHIPVLTRHLLDTLEAIHKGT